MTEEKKSERNCVRAAAIYVLAEWIERDIAKSIMNETMIL